MIDRQTFRDAMARLGAAVNVVTTNTEEGWRGFTASAVCSVTDDPPTLLLCVNRTGDTHDALLASGIVCINTLSATQEAFSPLFAGFTNVTQAERFRQGVWSPLVTGAPALEDAVVSFDCTIADQTTVGTHTVFFCAVQAIRSGPAHEALIYAGRAYHRIPVPRTPIAAK